MDAQIATKINGHSQVVTDSTLKKKPQGIVDKWLQGNGFVYLEEPFSVSPYYDFLDAFLLGLKLDTYFSYSTDCINALVYTFDDYAYL